MKVKNPLLDALRNNGSKENYFESNASVVSYKTGIPVLDYYLGYHICVFNEKNELIDEYDSLGINCGCFVMFIGKPSTGKTSTAVEIAANIVRGFDAGLIIHFDLEQAMNYTRIQQLSKFTTQQLSDYYVLRQEKTTLDDMKKAIVELFREKINNPKKYKYKTGKLNEFGEEIEVYQPTVILLDSIASITMALEGGDKKTLEKMEEVSSQTERMRLTAEIGRFLNEILPYLRTVNIILIGINQIKKNSNINSFVPSAAELLYLDQDEAMSGGKAPQFLAHTLCKFIAIGKEKYTEEEHGINGFGVACKIIKSRTNSNGQIVSLVYDTKRGVSSLRSSFNYAKDMGLVGGNKNKYYFVSDKGKTFTLCNMEKEFREDRTLYKEMYDNIIPVLKTKLGSMAPEEMTIVDEEMDY